MEIFKIGLRSHLRSGWPIILGLVIIGYLPEIFKLFGPNETDEDTFMISFILFIIFLLPSIIIHINYYLVNRHDVLSYDLLYKELSISRKGKVTVFRFDEIDHVVHSISFNKAAKRSSFLTWDDYSHFVIFLKSSEQYTITSLLCDIFELPIDKEKILVNENFYRIAPKAKLAGQPLK